MSKRKNNKTNKTLISTINSIVNRLNGIDEFLEEMSDNIDINTAHCLDYSYNNTKDIKKLRKKIRKIEKENKKEYEKVWNELKKLRKEFYNYRYSMSLRSLPFSKIPVGGFKGEIDHPVDNSTKKEGNTETPEKTVVKEESENIKESFCACRNNSEKKCSELKAE